MIQSRTLTYLHLLVIYKQQLYQAHLPALLISAMMLIQAFFDLLINILIKD